MKVHKDNEHCVTLTPFSWLGKRHLMVCVGQYVALDPEGGTGRVRAEQDFWKEAPDAFAALGQAPVMDAGLPKPGAEALVAGFCRAPGRCLVPAQEVSFRVGGIGRRIAVFGDRERLPGEGYTSPAPFAAMPLVWERAFGGPDFPANPLGRGLGRDNAPSSLAPNLEDPEHFILSRGDRPEPVCPFPVDMTNPRRRALSGTYDKAWLDTRWPAYPDDLNPEFFHSAQPAQRLAGRGPAENPLFFRGDEEIELSGMHHDYPLIRSRLPETRIRAFVLTAERFVPFAPAREKAPLPYARDMDQPGLFQEVTLHLDTVWLLPDLMGAFTLRRGLLPVEDDEMDDILRVLVVTEKAHAAPQTLEFYREELRRRAYPAVEIDLAPFAAAQAKTTKAVKMARDMPKVFAGIKRNFLGQSPTMPLSLGDMAHSTRKSIATGRATLDALEKQMLAQKEQFSHLVNFDLSVFPRMRGVLDEQERNLDQTLRHAQSRLDQMGEEMERGKAMVRKNLADALKPPPDASKEEIAGKTALARELTAKLAALDSFTPEGVLCTPKPLNPWHDRGFARLIAARRALRRDDRLLARLAGMGLETKTLEDAWLGHAAEVLEDAPENWGLPKNPAQPFFTLPPGVYVPRFEGKALVALRVYPLDEPEGGNIRGLGTDAASIVSVPGSGEKPLSLPAAHPGGAVCVFPEDLSALFAEQEIGDFCHIVAACDPGLLAAAEDLPPLLPDVPAEKGGLPLLVILPPGEAGQKLFAPWRAAHPAAVPLSLPEGCPHVLALTEQGHRLRRLILDALPPELADVHDFDFPLPPKDRPPEPFKLNLPLPTKEELQERIKALISDIRSHFPDPRQMLADLLAEKKGGILAGLEKMPVPPAALAGIRAALEKPIPPPQTPVTTAELTRTFLARIAEVKNQIPPDVPPEIRLKILAKLDEGAEKMRLTGEKLAPLDKLREEGMNKLAALKKGVLPEEVRAVFAEKGLDPDALKKPTRAEVEAELAGRKNFSRRNLGGLDLSGLDFSGACLDHALCGKTNFSGCRMDGADFTFALAHEANFSGATFRDAVFKQTVLQKAVLCEADFTAARLELVTLGECRAEKAVFDRAHISLANFSKAALDGARFDQTLLSLCAFSQVQARGADFRRCRAFKCLFQKADLDGAIFREAALNECLFQQTAAAGLCFAGADMRKFYADAETDLSGADFSGADLREASLRLSRLPGADFYRANLESALVAQCDLDGARLDGLRAAGCRFVKCDLNRADISGANLHQGSLRKCRLTGADISGANLYGADIRNMVMNGDTRFEGANFKRTPLDGKEEDLRDVARGNS